MKMEAVRLQKYLSDCGVASRRKAEELILDGQVKVNGRRVELGTKIVPEKDLVTVNGKKVKIDGMTYGGFNKAKGEPAEAFMKALLAQYKGDIIEYEQSDKGAATPES